MALTELSSSLPSTSPPPSPLPLYCYHRPNTPLTISPSFVIVPDHPTASRPQNRPAHIAHATSPTTPYRFGGAFKSPTDDPASSGFVGSAMVMMAESVDDALNKLREDPYTKGGVWDLDRARIFP